MDVFGAHWTNHVERLEEAWRHQVAEEDTVIVAGDIDWALHLDDALQTLDRIDGWPGRKVLIRGNHDYWWSSKTTAKVRRALPPSLSLIHNDSVQADGFNICGAKGSPVPGGLDWTDQDAKLLNREVQRLEASLATRDPALPTIAALHFPPFYPAHDGSPYRETLESARVSACVYGHLHAEAAGSGPRGEWGPLHYVLVAADAVGFRPVQIEAGGEIAAEAQAAGQVHR